MIYTDEVLAYWGTDSCVYPDMENTAVWILNRPLIQAQRDWSSTRYEVEVVVDMYGDDDEPDLTINTSLNPGEFHPMMRKFENTDSQLSTDSPSINFQDYFSYYDFPVFRISEMYLTVVKVLMLSNPGTAVERINTLREKRAFDGKENDMQITQVDLNLDFIRAKCAREFAGKT